jgi:hypothetical protein
MTMDYIEARAEYRRTAAKKARQKQAAKEKAERDEKRAKLEAFRLSLAGLTRRQRQDAMRSFKDEMRQIEEQQKVLKKQAKEYWRRERERQRIEAGIQAERHRVNRLVESGAVGGMSEQERREWIEQCRQVNPIMFSILKEKGIA